MTIAVLKKPLPASLILVLVWTAWRLAFLAQTGIPQPEIHDEFSYLLGADTFAHGRMANPAPPLGKFFESPHILVRPTYSSKYPPGQALFLALGQRLFGSPFYGVLLGNGLMLFTLCLMLFAWVSSGWALGVSAMFALCLWPGMYWTNSYSGGSVAASGGALVLLGIGIYRTKPKPYAGTLFALGVLLLFWTRPFEGGVFTLIVLIVFAKDLWRIRGAGALVGALSLLAAGGIWTCYYNQAVTGHPLLLPYLLHDRQYNVAPVLWLLPLRPEPTYSHPRLISQHGTGGSEVSVYLHQRRVPPFQFAGSGLLLSIWTGLYESVRPLTTSLAVPVLLTLLVPVAWRDPVYRKMAIVTGVFLLALVSETFHKEHYTAPVWAAVALMVAVWAERVWDLRIRKLPVGAALVLLSLTSPASTHLPSYVLGVLHGTPGSLSGHSGSLSTGIRRRKALIEQLSVLGQPQLVIVRYPSPEWNVGEEWVYNGADIDHERVVFAHDLGKEQDVALLRYYSDRRALLMTFDSVSGQEIAPYPLSP